eukprot:gb/GFBE01028598.1/.p1 GENE.gb/GFBE01028598.1/~~gb/GFBE01028598.1/.p1  ORF type:complete len:258 (+),score=49.27 gb/GFBE01028598.1/:1-774(+)
MMKLSAVGLLLCAARAAATATEIELDASLGCADGNNVLVALLLGVMGGAFACIFPCCGLCLRAQRRWAQDFLDASNPKVGRVDATVIDKQAHHSGGDQGSSTSYTAVITFEVKRGDGASVPLRAQCGISSGLWSRISAGAQVEVAYALGNEKDFAIVEDLKERSEQSMGKRGLLTCAFGVFAVVGLAIAGASLPLTGCFLGLVSSIALILGGSAAGHFVFFPMTRMLTQSRFYVTTATGAATPSEKVLGATNTLAGV